LRRIKMIKKLSSLFLLTTVIMFSWISFAGAKDDGNVFKVFGYGQAWYVNDDSDISSTATAIDNEFYIKRARLGVKGKSLEALSPQFPVNYKFLGEFAGSSAVLLDAVVNVQFHPLFQVQVGQFKYHFTISGYRLAKIKDMGLITRPEIVKNIALKLGQTGGSYRDIGVNIHGEQKEGDVTFGYSLEILNGSGPNTTVNTADENNGKTIIITPYVKAMGVQLSGSYFTGKDGIEGSDLDESGWTLGAEYNNGPLWLRTEYVQATYDQGSGVDDVKPNGWYFQAAYDVIKELQVLGRYGVADTDSNLDARKMSTIDIGANYRVNKHATLSLNYLIRDAEDNYSEFTLWGKLNVRGVSVQGDNVGNIAIAQFEFTF
jgi:phosphate-selective porin